MYELKQMMLNNKIQFTLLGLFIPFALVAIAYQLRYTFSETFYKLLLVLALSSVVWVPIFIMYLHVVSSLNKYDCIQHKTRSVNVEVEDKTFTMQLVYKVVDKTKDRYRLLGNDQSAIWVKHNRIDLDSNYRHVPCPISIGFDGKVSK